MAPGDMVQCGLGRVRFMTGLDDLKGHIQPVPWTLPKSSATRAVLLQEAALVSPIEAHIANGMLGFTQFLCTALREPQTWSILSHFPAQP